MPTKVRRLIRLGIGGSEGTLRTVMRRSLNDPDTDRQSKTVCDRLAVMIDEPRRVAGVDRQRVGRADDVEVASFK